MCNWAWIAVGECNLLIIVRYRYILSASTCTVMCVLVNRFTVRIQDAPWSNGNRSFPFIEICSNSVIYQYNMQCNSPPQLLKLKQKSSSQTLVANNDQNVPFHPHNSLPLPSIPKASLREDLLTGPSAPPFPRPLHKVIKFSTLTGVLWYGYYKFCIEEELLAHLGRGPGGLLALGPFTAGILSPLFLPGGGPAETGVALGVAWIIGVQFSLYKRINEVCEQRGMGRPLSPGWVIVPGFNLVVGLRSIHFLSVAWGSAEDDPVVKVFPCLGVPNLGFVELLTTPSLWVKLF